MLNEDFIFYENIIEAEIEALENEEFHLGETFNIGSAQTAKLIFIHMGNIFDEIFQNRRQRDCFVICGLALGIFSR